MDYDDNTTSWFHCQVRVDYVAKHIGLFLFHLIVFIVGLTMNVTVVWVNWQRRHSRNTVLFCLLNMGLADTMMVVMLPVYMLEMIMDHVWLWGDFLCRFSTLVVLANMYASSLFLAYMSAERYLAVARGSTPRAGGLPEKRKRALICVTLWALALFCSSLEAVHKRILEFEEPGCYMIPEHNYEVWYYTITGIRFVVQFAVPTAIIITSNVLAARAVHASPEVQSRSSSEVWLLHLYSLVFVVCWLPYHIELLLVMVDTLNPNLLDCVDFEYLFFSIMVIRSTTFLHCLANPILYSFMSRSFRGKLINLILHHLPQDAVSKQGTDQPGNPQGDAPANGTKATNGGENSTSQSEG